MPERLATSTKQEQSDFFLARPATPYKRRKLSDGTNCRSRSNDAQSALMRAERRDSLRATVFRCITPFVVARCNSGSARRNADCAAFLSPVSIALSTFLTKVRTRLNRERLVAVRFSVCRRRFSADL